VAGEGLNRLTLERVTAIPDAKTISGEGNASEVFAHETLNTRTEGRCADRPDPD
jgi:hypothetical protein